MNTKDIYNYSRKELAAKAVEIWEIHAPRYATNLETYHVLLKRKRELKVQPLHVIKRSVLRDYPDIPFLKLKSIEDVTKFLSKMNEKELRGLVIKLQNVLYYDYCFKTVSNWISEATCQIKNHGQRTGFGMDPGSISPKGRTRGQTSGKD